MGIYLETERLCIRDHVLEDLETHQELFSDEESLDYSQEIMTYSLEETKANLLEAIEQIDKPGRIEYFLRIEDKVTHEHIGEIGYNVTDFTLLGKCVHLGYFSHKKYWNKGYMTEAVKELMRFAFKEDDVYRITTGCIKENRGSERVMQKCGFIKEGEFKNIQWHNGKLKDRVQYRMLKEEWEQNEQRVVSFKINSMYLCVRDMERAIAFYEALLAQNVTEKDQIYSVFEIGGFRVGLFAYEKMREAHTYGNSTLPSLEVTDINIVQERLTKLGSRIIFPKTKIKNNWVMEFEDSEGNHIEVMMPCK